MGHRWRTVVGTVSVVALVTTPVAGVTPEVETPKALGASAVDDGARLADIEFQVNPGMTGAERGQLAIELWKVGVVESVTLDRGIYEVRLRHPGNLLHMEAVREVLNATRGVNNVSSFGDILRRSFGERR